MTSIALLNNKRRAIVCSAIVTGGLLNCLGSLANVAIGSPLFFDSIFTAAAGALWGPWAGIFCAVVTHIFLVIVHNWDKAWMYFLPCSMATGVITGWFSRIRRFNSAFDVIGCSILVTFANSLLGAIIGLYAYGGVTTHPSDYLITGLVLVGQSILAASFWARIPLNLIDKVIALTMAYGIARSSTKLMGKRG